MIKDYALIDVDEDAKCYLSGEYKINKKISMHFPTIREIMLGIGEQKYWQIVCILCATTSDMIAQLDERGLDWETTDDFDVFAINFISMTKQDLSVLFPTLADCNFELEINQDNDNLILIDKEKDIVIDKNIYEHMASYIRYVHGIKKNIVRAANAYTHRDLIEDAYRELEYAKKRKKKKQESSQMKNYISYLIAEMHFSKDQVLDMNVNFFFDCVKRGNAVEQAKTMPFLIYYGMVDASNKETKKSLDPMRSI